MSNRNLTKLKGAIQQREPLFTNVLFGHQKTPEHGYEWKDITIQGGIGDAVIDLSYTVLPKGETVIMVRKLIGNVRVLVPYEVDVRLHHSGLAGSVTFFDYEEPKFFNQTLHLQTAGYEESTRKIKIITSMLSGDIEVKRI